MTRETLHEWGGGGLKINYYINCLNKVRKPAGLNKNELFNPFCRIGNPLERIRNLFHRFTHLVLLDCVNLCEFAYAPWV